MDSLHAPWRIEYILSPKPELKSGLFARIAPRRVALVHDWLTGMRGGEKVLEAIAELYPDATIHTLVHVRGSVSARLERHPKRRSFVQWLPSAARHRERLCLCQPRG